MSTEPYHVEPMVPLTFMYTNRVGEYMEKFLQGLAEKKILGIQCPECKRVLVPPRSACGQCNTRPEEWVEVQPTGVLENFTIGHVTIEEGEIKDLNQPVIIGMVRLDNAQSLLTARITGIKPEECKTGIRVQAVWKDQPEGTVKDLDHFEAVN